ncbi:MAG: DUF1616 domain-containing protein [Archaeoglobaceae archaeon]
MRNWDLLCIILLSILLIILIFFTPENPARIALGLAFILFFPGYSLVSFLFTDRKDLETIERIALSFGLSVAIVPLIGLALNYTPFGIRLEPILFSLSAFNILFSSLAILKRRKSLDPFVPKIKIDLGLKNASNFEKALTVALIAALIISFATLIYVILNPRQAESFTEFYILGPKGKASDYPTKLFVNQSASLIIGLVNHEQRTVNYTIEIWLVKASFDDRLKIESMQLIDILNVTLEHKPLSEKWEAQWELPYNFSIEKPGKYKIFFLLFKDSRPPLPFEAKKMDYAGTEAENRIIEAVEGRIQSLILNIEVREL